MAEKLLS